MCGCKLADVPPIKIVELAVEFGWTTTLEDIGIPSIVSPPDDEGETITLHPCRQMSPDQKRQFVEAIALTSGEDVESLVARLAQTTHEDVV